MSFDPTIGHDEFVELYYGSASLASTSRDRYISFDDAFGLSPKEAFELWLDFCAEGSIIQPREFLQFLSFAVRTLTINNLEQLGNV